MTLGEDRAPLDGREAGHGVATLACSPRPGGNSDTAAELFGQGFAAVAGGLAPRLLRLRDYRVEACTGCGACRAFAATQAHAPSSAIASGPDGAFLGCPLGRRDDSVALLRLAAGCEALCLVSPIYFYHLPARFKALLDRTQAFWELRQASGRDLFPPRPCFVILLGARPQGAKLFEGSLLSLRYALDSLNIRLEEPLLLHGLDQIGDLERRQDLRDLARDYGAQAARRILEPR
jgi:multimeric flavodoxin WrbA